MASLTKKIRNFKLNLSLKFIIACGIIITTTLGIFLYVIEQRQERLIMKQVENEARSLFNQILITRRWVADHGGVFVEKLPWAKPNPHLVDIGIEAEITGIDGRRFVKRNPAMVTKELSKYAQDKNLYWFHITSLNLLNPGNAPDEFEKNALLQFETDGNKEFMSVETINNSKYFRYIAPLHIEETCLQCHAHQDYKVGDIRGAISVTIPVDRIFTEIAENRTDMLIAAMIIILSIMLSMFLMINKLVLTPTKKLKSSIKSFSEGKYHPQGMLETGDEFEELFLAFSKMAKTIIGHHDCLQDKVYAATRGMEDANKKLIETNSLLREANIRKSDFMAKASHEIRTPLTSIKGAMDYISSRLLSITQQKPKDASIDDLYIFCELIKKNSGRLIRMVNDLLALERIETGVSNMCFAMPNLTYLIVETLIDFQISANEKGILFRDHLPDNLPVYADEDKIKQVLINLLSNAIKFAPEESEIIIFAYRERNFVIVEIWDDGPGVSLSEQEMIFEKFYRNGNKEGSGLGLAICKSIIEAHNGIIGVKSDGKLGSCFYFKLPYTKVFQQNSHEKDFVRTPQLSQEQKMLELAKKLTTPC